MIDVGHDFLITEDGKLLIIDPGSQQFQEFTPDGLLIAARGGMFGFRLLEEDQRAAWEADREASRRSSLGKRGRITEDQRGRS